MKFSRFVKKFLYGTLPYSLHKTFRHDSELQRYYEYIMRYGYSRHLFEFRHEYKADDIDVLFDDDASHHYVISPNGHRLYFKKGMSADKIRGLYNELLIEQDKRSAHRYFDNPSELDDYTILDVGAAEGLITLLVIDKIKKAYLFECDPLWSDALRLTFKNYPDKVVIVDRLVSDTTDNWDTTTIDDFMRGQPNDKVFLKMDIEGFEQKALDGASELIENGVDLKFAIATYHSDNDVESICRIFTTRGYQVKRQLGYFRRKLRCVMIVGNNISNNSTTKI